jgi:hypothetical protein
MKAKEVIHLFKKSDFKGRHGDVVIVRDDSAPTEGKKDARGVVAEGEATGHAHRVDRAKVLRVVDDLVQRTVVVPFRAKSPAKISHEEHTTQVIPPGKHRTGIQRQYSPDGWRQVQD